ncbi:MAG: gas vesicle protein GvpN [Bacillota bacterium]
MEIQNIREINQGFIETPFLKNLIKRMMLYLHAGFPVHLRGPAGTGKTSLAFQLAKQLKQPFMLVFGSDNLDMFDLIGGRVGFKQKTVVDKYVRFVEKREEHFQEEWIEERIVTACKNGYTLIYDEFTRSKPEINNSLLSILEERIVEVPSQESTKFMKVHPNFKAIFTSNPVEYAGVHKMQDALLERMITVNLLNMDYQTKVSITAARSGVSLSEAEQIVSMIEALRNNMHEKSRPSIRGSIMIAQVAKQNNIPIDFSNQIFMEICSDILNIEFQEHYSSQKVKKLVYEALPSVER